MKIKTYITFAFFLFAFAGIKAQEAKLQHTNVEISADEITSFYDGGGAESNYADHQHAVYTIRTKNGKSPYVNFTAFSTEKAFDIMYIYDGSPNSSKLIGAYSGGSNPGTVQASGNQLTIVFTSDGSGNFAGWAATVGSGALVNKGTLPSVSSASNCADADPFCTGTTYTFPASTSTSSQTGPDYGCLLTQPNPAWYYLQIANSGNLVLSIAGSGGADVDFICWGPFTSPSNACAGLSASGNIVDCSYSTSATETCTIPNGVSGQFYMVLITNYANISQNIVFNQVGGSGSTNCSIVTGCTLTASNSGPYCPGQTINLTASNVTGASYSWSGPGGFTSTSQNPTRPGSTVAMSGTYTVIATAGTTTCSATTAVTVNASPTVTVNSPTICKGGSTVLTASGATTYSWSPGTGLSATTGANPTANPTVTTTYTVVGTSATCTSSATSIVTVNPLPTVTVASATICPGSSTTLAAAGASTYTWAPSATLSSSTGTTVTASPASNTTYTITGATAAGCTATTTASVTIGGAITPSVASATICAGSSTTLNASGGTTYTWSPATGLSGTTGASVTANPATTTTYTINAASGACTGTTTAVVTVNPMPTVSVNSPSICINGNTTLTATGATTYSWSPATGLSASTGASVTANPTVTTTYTVVGTSATCTASATSIVTVNPLPVITVSSASICPGASATLTSSGASTYTWSTGANGTSITASPATTTNYTVTGTNASGCVNTATASITVLTGLTITPPSATICIGSSQVISAVGATTYTWSPAAGLSSSTGASVTASPTVTTTYTITGASGTCSAVATATVIVNPLPTVAVNSGTICNGQQTATLTATGATTYTWSPATGLSSANGGTVTATPIITTPYTVTGTDGNGCVNSNTTIVTVNPLPVVTLSPALICLGGSTTLTAAGALTYSWIPGTGLSSTTGASVTANPATTTQYTVIGIDANGCINGDTATLTVVTNPVINVPSATICVGNSATLNANGATTYVWSPATGLSATNGASVTANPTATTVYTIDGTVGTCTATTTATVVVNPLPVITIGSNSPVCVNQTLNLASTGGPGYSWNGPNSFSSAQQNPTITGVTGAAGGVYTLTVVDANTCVNTASVAVIVNPLPIVTVSGSTVCLNATINLGATGGTNYSWSGPAGFSSNLQNPTIANANPANAGTYVVTVTDNNNCVNANVALVTVNGLPTINVTSGSICAGKSTPLTASGANTYNWAPTTGLSSSTGSVVSAGPTTTSTYTITGTDLYGCQSTAVTTVTVTPGPAVSVTPSFTSGCAPVCTTFSNTATGNGAYNWTFGNGQTSAAISPTNCFPVAGNYVISLTVIDSVGCVGTNTAIVTVYPMPHADFSSTPQPTTILDNVIHFSNQSSGAFISTTNWNLGNNTTSTVQNPTCLYGDTGTYAVQLSVTTNHGCKDSVVKYIRIDDEYSLYVPNAFSPNADGTNDVFYAKGEGIRDFKMYIYDRWGNMLFFTDDITKGWDGRFMSKGETIVQEDVYVWKIECKTFKGEKKHLSGHVSLLK